MIETLYSRIPGEFTIETLDASFRYPMDFTYHIQNFSAINYNKVVKAGQEASVFYSFIPADAFAGRPIGLTINLAYRYTRLCTLGSGITNSLVPI